jgi:hypothetical protein
MLNVRTVSWICAVVLGATAIACGGKKYTTVTIPPRLELGQFERAALATFTVENAKGTLHELATRRFAEHVLAASRDVEVLEIGSVTPVLQQVGESQFGPQAAKAIGMSHDVPVVFAGHLKVSNAKASGGSRWASIRRRPVAPCGDRAPRPARRSVSCRCLAVCPRSPRRIPTPPTAAWWTG